MMYGNTYPHYPSAMSDMYGGPPPHLAHQPPPHLAMHPRPPYPMPPAEPSSPSIDMYQTTVMKFHYPQTNPMHYQAPPHQPYHQQSLPIEQQNNQHNKPVISQVDEISSLESKVEYNANQIPGPSGTSQSNASCSSPTQDFTAGDTSFTGIGTNFETPKSKPTPKPRGKFFCDVCKIDLLKDETYQSHIRGFMHTRKAAEKTGNPLPKSTAGPVRNEEQKSKVIKDLREKYPDQYCEVCDTTMTSELVFQQHIQGMRHQKNLRYRAKGGPILRGRGSRKLPHEQQEAEKNLRCQKMLDEQEEPLIGLQFMTEFTKNNPNVEERYVCDICNGKCDPRTLVPHIVGAKHRYNYIKYQHTDLFTPHAEAFKSMRKAEKTQLMGELALMVAEKEGDAGHRMKAKVEIDPFYNPNKDRKLNPEAHKRTQDAKEAGQPPAKKVPKAKVTPNWGGPDPSKLQVESNVGDGNHGSITNTPSPPPAAAAQATATAATANTVKTESQCLVNNEHEASMALQVSNTLTQALLQYRLKNLAKEASSKTK